MSGFHALPSTLDGPRPENSAISSRSSVAPAEMTSGNRRAAALAALGSGVARREDRDDPGGAPGLDGLPVERVVGAAAPGVVDHVRPAGRVRVVAGQVGRREDELAGGQQRGLGAAQVLTALGRDPARAGGDADVGRERAGAVTARDGAHRVRAVANVVTRLQAADAGRVPPVVVVGESAVPVVAAIAANQGRVRVLDAGVDVRNDDALTQHAIRPGSRCADLRDAPLRVPGCSQDGGPRGNGLHERVDPGRTHERDAVQARHALRQCGVTFDDEDVGQPVGGRVGACRLGDGPGRLLGLGGGHLERGDNGLAPRRVALDLGGRREVRGGAELDDERRELTLRQALGETPSPHGQRPLPACRTAVVPTWPRRPAPACEPSGSQRPARAHAGTWPPPRDPP